MYVEVQLDKGGFAVARVEDERDSAVFVRILEKNQRSELFSFKTPVWISKGKIISTYPENYPMEKFGYEQSGINLFREIEISSDEDYVPDEDEEEDEEEQLN